METSHEEDLIREIDATSLDEGDKASLKAALPALYRLRGIDAVKAFFSESKETSEQSGLVTDLAELLLTMFRNDDIERVLDHISDDLKRDLPSTNVSPRQYSREAAKILLKKVKLSLLKERLTKERPLQAGRGRPINEFFEKPEVLAILTNEKAKGV